MMSTAQDRNRWPLVAAVLTLLGVGLWSGLGDGVDAPGPGGPTASDSASESEPSTQSSSADLSTTRSTPEADSATDAGEPRLSGQVLDQNGRPVANATIQLDGRGELEYQLRSGPDGRFQLDDPLPGGYPVLIFGAEILTGHDYLRIPDQGAAVSCTLRVETGLILVGEVLNAEGRYVEGAAVTPWYRGAAGQELDRRRTVHSDPGGRFELRGRSDGPTLVLVECEGYRPRKQELSPNDPNQVSLRPRQ